MLLVREKIPTSTDQDGYAAAGGRGSRGGRGRRAEQVSKGPESSARLGLIDGHQAWAIEAGKSWTSRAGR